MNTRSRSYSKEIIYSALMGYRAGFSQRRISIVLKIPRTTIKEWIKDMRDRKIMVPKSIRHSHYWFIEEEVGLTVDGVCKICFQEKTFLNQLPDMWSTSEEKEWINSLVK